MSQLFLNLLIRIQAPDVALYVGRDNGNYMNGTVDEVRFCSRLNLRITIMFSEYGNGSDLQSRANVVGKVV